MPVLKWS